MPDTPPATDRLTGTLKSVFGFEKFRPGQAEILNDILAGRNVVAIIPTGGGKSLLYQLPAVLNKGVTLVISPLISLMKDQVDALQAKGIAATCITSALSPAEKAVRMEGLRRNRWRLVYVAPERMRDPHFMELIKGLTVDLLAVDEAHCISQWGHDFRPDYMHIKDLRRHIGTPVTIALTATATRVVRADIARHLELEAWEDHLAGFDRENLFFKVTEVGG
ncbi:MAG: RecQ family ATP-dependent DNA helicase, partial [Planctomycetota bacterium]